MVPRLNPEAQAYGSVQARLATHDAAVIAGDESTSAPMTPTTQNDSYSEDDRNPLDFAGMNHAAVRKNAAVLEDDPKSLGPAIEFVTPRVILRPPTAYLKDHTTAENDADEESESVPCCPSITSSPAGDSTPNGRCSASPVTPGEVLLGIEDGQNRPIERILSDELAERDEPQSQVEGRDEVGHRAANYSPSGDIDDELNEYISRAARTGHGVPTALYRRSSIVYEPSERSIDTSFGARGRRIAAARKDPKRPPALPETESELKIPLQDRLLDILQDVPGHAEKKGFFPEEQLDSLINETRVQRELESVFKGAATRATIERFAQQICGSDDNHLSPEEPLVFKKVFATLVLSEKTAAIPLFLEEGVTDDDLPLLKVRRQEKPPRFDLTRRKVPNQPIISCKDWNNLAIIRFSEWQWTTIAPFFGRSSRNNVVHLPLQDQIPLPFTADSRYDEPEDVRHDRLEFEGGYSSVFKADIHPEHHEFGESRRSFAIKCLLSRDREEFRKEVDTLKKFSGDAHDHLVSLLATYEQFRRFYLIFHWAEAHLLDFWKKEKPVPTVDYETVLWTAEQCSGIVDGLARIHRYESSHSKAHDTATAVANAGKQLAPESAKQTTTQRSMSQSAAGPPREFQVGRHGDIKPENVLWFRNPDDPSDLGVLKITDFGLTEFSPQHSKSYKTNSNLAASPGYRPPESDLIGGVIGSSYDIWTLGCLYLELITWLLGGWELVQAFQNERKRLDPMWYDATTDTFFEIVELPNETIGATGKPVGAMVKPVVTEFMFKLHCHEKCTEYIHELLNLIQMDMLIVKRPNPEQSSRIKCEELNPKLRAMLKKCKRDSVYAAKPAPWDPMDKPRPAEQAVEVEPTPQVADILGRKKLRMHTGHTQTRSGGSTDGLSCKSEQRVSISPAAMSASDSLRTALEDAASQPQPESEVLTKIPP